MRVRSALAALALLGCRETPGEPYPPTRPAPSGLGAILNIIPGWEAPLVEHPSVSADGDSVVTAASLSINGCVDFVARAGMAGGDLVVTVISSSPPEPRFCALDARRATFRTVVRPAPRGGYDVVLRERLEFLSDGPREREVGRARVVVR